MAQSITLQSGSKYIGCPITYRVVPSSYVNATFHRVRLKVEANLTGNTDVSMEFSSPVDDTKGYIDFDISSALRAAADAYTPTAITTATSYPTVTYRMTACDDYMVDGVTYEGQDIAIHSGDTAYMGALTDYERMFSRRPTRYSRKPRTAGAEIIFDDFKYIIPVLVSGNQPSVSCALPNNADKSGLNLYSIPAPQDGYEIQFVNSLGVHENVFVTCLRTAEVDNTTERHTIARQETLTQFSRSIAIKKNNHEQWKMSTGPLDYDWQQWYLHEFLKARWAWIGISENGADSGPDPENQVYIPIHIIPDESTKGIDRQKSAPLTVEFTIEFDIEGSPFI